MAHAKLLVIPTIISTLVGCAAGGEASSTVYNQGGTIGGDVSSTATGGAGGTVQVTPNLALDKEAFKYLFPGKALASALTDGEKTKASEFCASEPEKCVEK